VPTLIPRRWFIVLAGTAIYAPSALLAIQKQKADMPLVDQVPPMLDHILLGCSDLQRGIAFVEQYIGVRAVFGGVHPGRGTQNALLSLGASSAREKGRYLEIIAPDPQQTDGTSPLLGTIQKLAEPRLVGWAAHPRNIEALATQLKRYGIVADGPTPGSRKRPDGKELHWQTLNLQDDASGLLPFCIQWSDNSVHPSVDAPSGCQLLRFELLTPDPAPLAMKLAKLTLSAPVTKAAAPQLHAVIQGPKGTLSVTS
jgi:glyoxalase-like protein